MTHKQILKRYMFSLLGYSCAYAGSIIGVAFVIKGDLIENVIVKIGLVLIPAIFVMMMLRAFWVYLRDVDEAQRFFLQRSVNIAAFTILIFAGSWGVVEMMVDEIPKIPVFWTFPLFFVIFGLATGLGSARDMNKC